MRTLVNNDDLLEKGCIDATSNYNKQQFVPVRLEGVDDIAMITPFNELSDGRFYDPKSKKVFTYDHLRKEASDVHPANAHDIDEKQEPWRVALQQVQYFFVVRRRNKLVVCLGSRRIHS
jgi:capping protein alpha